MTIQINLSIYLSNPTALILRVSILGKVYFKITLIILYIQMVTYIIMIQIKDIQHLWNYFMI